MESCGMQSFVWLIKSMKPIHVDISVVPSLTAFVMFPFIIYHIYSSILLLMYLGFYLIFSYYE